MSSFETDSHIAVPLPCRATKGLECVFPIWFTQCRRVWFTLAMPCPDHAVILKATAQHNTSVCRRPCCAVALRRTAWSEHGMTSVNQTRPHFVNQMGKTHSKPLVARHGRETAWARPAICDSAFNVSLFDPTELARFLPRRPTTWAISSEGQLHTEFVTVVVTCDFCAAKAFVFLRL